MTSLHALVEKAQTLRPHGTLPLTLEFGSLCTFNRGGTREGEYGSFFARLPLPHYLFPNLVKRWQDIAPPHLCPFIQFEAIERYLSHEGVIIVDYHLTPHHIHMTTHEQSGFLGTCTYHLRGPDEATTPEAPLTVRQQLWLLAQLAFYSGIGYKTAMGLGQARVLS
jgi:CRISPR/Cas system endoribonuclease Cas6 (RAMP superfamily)